MDRHEPQISEHGWTSLEKIIADLMDAKILGLVAATFLAFHGVLTAEDFRWIFGFYIGGVAAGRAADAYAEKARVFGARVAALQRAIGHSSADPYSGDVSPLEESHGSQSRGAAGGQGRDRAGLPQQGR